MLKSYLLNLEQLNYAPGSIRILRDIIQKFALYMKKTLDKPIETATSHDIEKYALVIKGLYTPSSVEREVSGLRCFFRYLKKEGIIFFNPFDLVEIKIKVDKIPKHIPSVEAMRLFLDHPDTTKPLGLRDKAILELMYSSALRNQEVANIRIQDLDLKNKVLFIHKAKGGKQRLVPITQRACDAVEAYLAKGRSYYVKDPKDHRLFITLQKKSICIDGIRKVIRRHSHVHHETMHMCPHDLRHACATHMLNNGCNLAALKALLGHTRLEATQIYTHVSIQDLKAAHLKHHS